jgi:SSS family solute:Na+ symporter
MSAATLGFADSSLLVAYATILIVMGIYFTRRSRTSEEFMVAARSIPAWAAGLAVMSTYTSSISYIAAPGKAYDTNFHVIIFALCIFPVAWVVTRYVVPYYQKIKLISAYSFLEQRLGGWARFYAALSFLLYMTGRVAVILYLTGVLMDMFIPWPIGCLIIAVGLVTIIYTLLGGMEAVIWTDVMQSLIMIAGILFCATILTVDILQGTPPLLQHAVENNKFSLGSLKLTLTSRTVWVMIIYGVTENLRNLMADQNYVQKYSSVATVKEAKRSIWMAMWIYIPLQAIFLYIGVALFAYYQGHPLPAHITKGDQVFPYFIATVIPIGLKGLIIAAIIAAAMSTVDSALNCSATVSLLDFYKRYLVPHISEKGSVIFLRVMTVFWGVVGMSFALLMMRAESALDVWWQISGIFGGGILGLFLLSLLWNRIKTWQGITGIIVSILFISWATFARKLPPNLAWLECHLESIIIGAVGTGAMLAVVIILSLISPLPKSSAIHARINR